MAESFVPKLETIPDEDLLINNIAESETNSDSAEKATSYVKRMSQGAIEIAQNLPSINQEALSEGIEKAPTTPTIVAPEPFVPKIPKKEEEEFDWFDVSPEDYPDDGPDWRFDEEDLENKLKLQYLKAIQVVWFFGLLGLMLFQKFFFALVLFSLGMATLFVDILYTYIPAESVTLKGYMKRVRQPLSNFAVISAWYTVNQGRVITCLLIFTIVHVLHAFLMQFILNQLNEKTFKERLFVDRFRQYVLQHMHIPIQQRASRPSYSAAAAAGAGQTSLTAAMLFRPPQYNYVAEEEPAEGDSLVQDILRYGDTSTARVSNAETVASAAAGDYEMFKTVLNRRLSTAAYLYDKTVKVVSSAKNREWKEEAKELFEAYSSDGIHIKQADLEGTFAWTKRAARDAFQIFDMDGTGKVNARQFRDAIIRIHTQHLNLVCNIKDYSSAFATAARMLMFVWMIVLLFVSLAIFDMNVYVIISLTFTILLSLGVIIGEPIKNFLLSVVYLFVYEAVSIGDEVIVQEVCPDEVLRVQRLNLFLTILSKANGAKVYCQNFRLYNSTIVNLTRTRQAWEKIDFELPAEEPVIEQAKQCIRIFAFQNPDFYFPNFHLKVRSESPFNRSDKLESHNPILVIPYTLMIRCRASAPVNIRHTRLMRMLQELLQTLHERKPITEKPHQTLREKIT